ncbi:DUF1444 family protein [Bordetella bronchialis]|uniref:DUF1444 domain-containing protein n=1 Tax=Bordetella bronchialis TaxID=463025 RepID=A0A193FNJ2_9BORD|nr:DUF1444 family protein [Bordetella bronchialis]ANN68838.1 hypothetical protein BAU06_23305 [Bordetella bronchialis]ANN73982.1 hypothetical protein BAU08_23860 [Bordetella bronchialis]
MSLLKRLLTPRTARPLDAREFARAYADAARARFPKEGVGVEADAEGDGIQVRWSLPDGQQVTQSLGNAYAAYAKAPADLDAILAAHLDAAPAGAKPDAASRRAAILPVVKTRMWLTASTRQLQSAGAGDGERFVAEPLTQDLMTVYVEDRPDAMSYVAPDHLADLGLAREALPPLARENLRRLLPQLTIEGEDGCYGVRLDGNYDASLVFLTDEWRDRVEIEGDPVVAIPAREELLVCGTKDRHGQNRIRNIAAHIMARSPYGLSAMLYVWRDGVLTPYEN